MRLIEKECPNCGAGLHFTKDDTTCKCEYCKREFEIERDTEKKKLDDQFSLSELKTPFKIFSYFTFGSIVTQSIMMLTVFVIIVVLAFNIIKGINDSNSIFNRDAALVTNISELSHSDYSTIDINSRIFISKETAGLSGMYNIRGNARRRNLYVVSNEKTNYLIAIYRVRYTHLANSNDQRIVYIPVIYKNVKTKNNSIAFSLDDCSINAPEYYFNDNEYTYGYTDKNDIYDELIKPYEADYKIEKK